MCDYDDEFSRLLQRHWRKDTAGRVALACGVTRQMTYRWRDGHCQPRRVQQVRRIERILRLEAGLLVAQYRQ